MVNKDSEHASSLMMKLAQAKPNEITPLTTGEMELYRSDDFQMLHLPEQGEPAFIKVEPGSNYVAIAKQNTDIDDILNAGKHLNVKIGIIRDYD